MRISGARTIRAAPADIWDFLMTPSRLRGCLPGCESFEATGADSYEATLRLGVAFLKGTYTGTLRVGDAIHPHRFRMDVQGGGPLGALTASGTVRMVEAGSGAAGGVSGSAAPSTYFFYEGEAHVSGRVAALGQPIIEATANRLIGAFFDCVSSKVEQG